MLYCTAEYENKFLAQLLRCNTLPGSEINSAATNTKLHCGPENEPPQTICRYKLCDRMNVSHKKGLAPLRIKLPYIIQNM